MTREELINELKRAIKSPSPSDKQVACGMAIKWLEKNTDKGPQGLDEAAEKLIDDIWKWEIRSMDMNSSIIMSESKVKDILLRMYQAGAKWMAGQGVTKDGLVAAYDNGCLRVYATILDKEDGIKFGDKVIVQIRKAE